MKKDYYIQGDPARAEEIKAAFQELGINVLDFGFADKAVVYCSIGECVQYLPYSINLMNILYSHPAYMELPLPVKPNPKFKIGDWLWHKTKGIFPLMVEDYDEKEGYLMQSTDETKCYFGRDIIENEYRLWIIQDAKDGDVLVASDESLFIFARTKDNAAYYHYSLCKNGSQEISDGKHAWEVAKYCHPATKEQRDLLFAKMKEAGYEWDADKKELRKIIKPKFKVGDWITNDYCAGKVIALTDDAYLLDSGQGIPFSCEHNAHLWTIQDAKDGDVLVDTLSGTRALTILFRFINADDSISAYCGWNGHTFRVTIDGLGYGTLSSTQYVPATEEQRGLLFAKMREAGYQWYAEKKELKKFPKHYDISSFYAGMPVLVRDMDDEQWTYTEYSHYDPIRGYKFMTSACQLFVQCIPFNKETKHLLGTTDMCEEKYINW